VRLNFGNNLTTTPTITSLGNTGSLDFPHSLSKLFRVNDDVYAFITNVANSTITRLRFAGCTNASVSSSTLENPQPVTYSTPGNYNINLTIDDGLPTQASYCKQVVVLPEPTHTPTQAINLCTGDDIKIGTGVKYAKYTWNTSATTDSIIVNTAGTYWVQTDRFGCTNKDTMVVTEFAKPVVDLGPDATLCKINNLVLDAGNPGATYLWQDGSTSQTLTVNAFGRYYVQVTGPGGCVSSDTITISAVNYTKPAFTYAADVCNPLSVEFTGIGTGILNPAWDFGDGVTATGNLTETHTYASYGNYPIKFAVEINGCKDTVTQTISVNVSWANLILTPDTTICYNSPKQLRTQPGFNFCWSPTTWLSDPNSPNPITSTPENITYYFTAQMSGNNMVVNGDFSNGNTGFTSNYPYNTVNRNDGEYYVGTSTTTWNAQMSTACRDHTTGAGNMLIVNGSPNANQIVWSQTINTVTPQTDYVFIAWVQNLSMGGSTSYPPKLQAFINGAPLGNVFQPGNTQCLWDRFYIIWNSGNNTSANILIIN
jgi:PKD repeat protein